MFTMQADIQKLFLQNNRVDEFYEALAKDDAAEGVMVALDILKKTDSFVPVVSLHKSEEASTQYRISGNSAYKNGLYQQALIYYNKALLFAPIKSREMILAYGNRSALFCHMKLYRECNIDLNKCFAMGCPHDIDERLINRLQHIQPLLNDAETMKTLIMKVANTSINEHAKQLGTKIPSESTNVKVMIKDTGTKVIATSDIKVGAVLGTEEAYVSLPTFINAMFACHFCQRKALNLIPCEGCCEALFCDEECKRKCMKEYHVYECKMMDTIKALHIGSLPWLSLIVCFKLRLKCKSWKEFIDSSYLTGTPRVKLGTVQEIFDVKNPFSILTFNDDRPFIYGKQCSYSFICGAIFHYLQKYVPSFLPNCAKEKEQALRALGRVMIYLNIHQTVTYLSSSHINIKLKRNDIGNRNYGVFPFTGKLKTSCTPNLLVSNHNNKAVLICISPIKAGDELTVSYILHKHDFNRSEHIINVRRFVIYGKVCDCTSHTPDSKKMGQVPIAYLLWPNIQKLDAKYNKLDIAGVYPKLLKYMEMLKDFTDINQYNAIFALFRKCIVLFESALSDSYVLDDEVEMEQGNRMSLLCKNPRHDCYSH